MTREVLTACSSFFTEKLKKGYDAVRVRNQNHGRSTFTNIQMMLLYESGNKLMLRPTTLLHSNVFVDGLSNKVRLSSPVAKSRSF